VFAHYLQIIGRLRGASAPGRAVVVGVLGACALVLGTAPPAWADVTMAEFPANGQPQQIVSGPDGALWFTLASPANDIGRITPDGTTIYYSIPTSGSFPQGIASGPDGNLWFTEQSAGKVGKITQSGAITEYSTGGFPTSITAGPDGNLWFTQTNADEIGKITPSGALTEYPVPTASSQPTGIVAGPDGNLWFTEFNADKIGEITTGGTITEYQIPTANSDPVLITAGPDDNLWFTERGANQIGRVTTGGAFTEFPLPTASPNGIAAGPDGAIYFTELAGKIGRITTSGTITEYATPTGGSYPEGITTGPDGNMWFTESGAAQIGRFSIPGVATTPSSLTFPSQPVGTTSQSMTVTVSNTGPGRPLAISGVALSGANAGDFAINSDACTGTSLAVNGTCTVGVSFGPTAIGTRSASLVLADNALDSPQSLALTGTGAPSADVGISLGATPNPVKVGRTLTYTITVSDFGPTAASSVSVTDALPSTVQFQSQSTTQGTCTTPAVGASGTVNCSVGSLANGAIATVTLVVKVISTAKATIADSASGNSTSYDPKASNASATVTTNVFGRH
jgi:uncharacterized repeat protein (TIGR01451 family)